ncbi:adenosylcobinamide-GDP ribazoletransferase [Nocardioides sp. TRM66260-LWL]|uniref:adenosylcobinamide-GDP ribazoletransferase n=1 Tax=Nocardioides sp. TRM66260-LWL TaxID=2874478 RepID=UPI001CC6AE87|nr:adenosylcobinamide-GDP ribazoletransferase [Nocardioides sp. TRM66260-LWL]MBZ5734066.1 adenosylcobinamide-GDP ribazoletransferase [Nocardioides sp. TRM66260-LWL]
MSSGVLRDAWRLAVGTLTVLRVAPPATVDRRRAGLAMVLAPLAVAPLGVAAAAVVLVGTRLGLAPLVIGLLVVGALALGSRALHLDGLADLADGLTASYDRERSLAVMRSGTAGPAGVVTLVVVLGLQAAGVAAIVVSSRGETGSAVPAALLVGVAVAVSRSALAMACVRGVPGARADGLGSAFVGTVAPVAAVAGWLAGGLVLGLLASGWPSDGALWRPWGDARLLGLAAVGAAAAVSGLVLRRATARLGGVTGDVFGACVELALTALLVVLGL